MLFVGRYSRRSSAKRRTVDFTAYVMSLMWHETCKNRSGHIGLLPVMLQSDQTNIPPLNGVVQFSGVQRYRMTSLMLDIYEQGIIGGWFVGAPRAPGPAPPPLTLAPAL